MNPLVVALAFITLHGPTGKRIDINGESIVSLRDAAAVSKGHLSQGTHCVVYADGGAGISVMETCDEVRRAVMKPSGPCMLVCGESPKR